jgi:hypothetical protein
MPFKIRKKSTGEFSTGGMTPSFVKDKGKVWKTMGHVSSHLNLVNRRQILTSYADCEIVEFEMIEVSSRDLNDFLAEKIENQRQKEQEAKNRREEYEKEQRYQEYLKLKQEFKE